MAGNNENEEVAELGQTSERFASADCTSVQLAQQANQRIQQHLI